MGRGSTEPQRKIFYYSIRAEKKLIENGVEKKITAPHFQGQTKGATGYENVVAETELSGYFVRMKDGQYEFPKNSGKMVKTIGIVLVDGDEQYNIECNLNSGYGRNLMNNMASLGLNKVGKLKIRLYQKDGFAKMFMENDGESIGWAFDWEQLKSLVDQAPDPQVEGKMMNVYHRLNAFLFDAWKKAAEILNKTATPPPATAGAAAEEHKEDTTEFYTGTDQAPLDTKKEEAPPIDTADDLPF